MKKSISIRILVDQGLKNMLGAAWYRFKNINLGEQIITVNYTMFGRIKKMTKNIELLKNI